MFLSLILTPSYILLIQHYRPSALNKRPDLFDFATPPRMHSERSLLYPYSSPTTIDSHPIPLAPLINGPVDWNQIATHIENRLCLIIPDELDTAIEQFTATIVKSINGSTKYIHRPTNSTGHINISFYIGD